MTGHECAKSVQLKLDLEKRERARARSSVCEWQYIYLPKRPFTKSKHILIQMLITLIFKSSICRHISTAQTLSNPEAGIWDERASYNPPLNPTDMPIY